MSDIDFDELRAATRDVIRKAAQDDTLHEVTLRIARRKVEEQLGLEEGALDTRELKDVVKDAVSKAVEEVENGNTAGDEKMQVDEPDAEEKPASSKKRKSDVAPASDTRKKPRAEKADKTESAAKPKAKSSTSSADKAKDDSKKSKGQKVVRSASVVPSSDEDEDGEPKAKAVKEASTPAKQKSPAPAESSKQGSMSEDDDPESSREEPKKQRSSDSEEDEPAPKRGKGKKKADKEPSKKASAGRKRKAKDTEESPQDAEIKRLKSFVVACGVRKVWSKEFKDITDDKGAQIRRLKALLAELGMTGRLSMEKAKAIRAKRELAQELEDVKNFERAVVSGPRSRRGKPAAESEDEDNVPSDDDEEEEGVPRKKRALNARMRIMAFLGDQSDED